MHDSHGAPVGQSQKKRYITITFWLSIIAILIFVFIRGQNARDAQAIVEDDIQWDSDLLACNDVFDASPSENFDTCLRMAEEGWIDAAQRIAWAYSRDGEHQSWQQAYEWLKWLSAYDDYAQLLGYIILFEIGEDDNVKIDGERGIREMAVVNHPAASAYLASMYYLGTHQLPKNSNIAWLLERAYQQSKYWVMPEEIARVYANGFLGTPQIEKAKSLLFEATNIDFPLHANNVAWLFATTNNQALSDPEVAVELATEVVNEQAHADNYTYVDTLAAAYAANQQFEEAIQTQKKAISLLQETSLDETYYNEQLAEFEKRLRLFESKQAYIIEDASDSGQSFFESFKHEIEQALIENLYVEFNAPEIELNTHTQ